MIGPILAILFGVLMILGGIAGISAHLEDETKPEPYTIMCNGQGEYTFTNRHREIVSILYSSYNAAVDAARRDRDLDERIKRKQADGIYDLEKKQWEIKQKEFKPCTD